MLFLATLAAAATSDELAVSMEIPAADTLSTSVSGASNMYDVMPSSGVLVPTAGADFAYLFTGKIGTPPQGGYDQPPGGVAGDAVDLDVVLDAPPTANSMAVDFYFLSAEYPEWVGSPYNDVFEMNVASTAWSGNAAIDSAGNPISINSVLFLVVDPAAIKDTGFDNTGGGTGWLTVLVPVDAGKQVTVNFHVEDVSDGVYDSAVLLDNFRWSEGEIDTPTIVVPIALTYVSPKRGPTTGGTDTYVYGENFNSTCVSYFDGVAAPTSYISESTLQATPPAHAEGMVDVKVSCTGSDDTIGLAYTYYDPDAGALPPDIESASPYQVDVAGGEAVTVTGTGFQSGLTATIDGAAVSASAANDTTVQLTTPPHAEGLVDLVITNPDGLTDTFVGALLYVDQPTWPPVDTAATNAGDTADLDGDGKADTSGDCGCATPATPPASSPLPVVGLLAAAAALLRRRA